VKRDLEALFDPRSVAVVGASSVPGKWGFWLAHGAVRGDGRRSVFLVNRKGGEILGRSAYASLAELPEAPELVVISVPAAGLEEAVRDSLAAGAKALVAISAGLGEMSAEGRVRERAIVERVRAADAVLVGPNCLGVYDAQAELELCSEELRPGSIGLISQSGNLGLEIGMIGEEFGLGFSRFVSLGNQADVEAAELVEAFAAHEPTRLIVV
jgi:acetate---CoA ligase (ADP-forming)